MSTFLRGIIVNCRIGENWPLSLWSFGDNRPLHSVIICLLVDPNKFDLALDKH